MATACAGIQITSPRPTAAMTLNTRVHLSKGFQRTPRRARLDNTISTATNAHMNHFQKLSTFFGFRLITKLFKIDGFSTQRVIKLKLKSANFIIVSIDFDT